MSQVPSRQTFIIEYYSLEFLHFYKSCEALHRETHWSKHFLDWVWKMIKIHYLMPGKFFISHETQRNVSLWSDNLEFLCRNTLEQSVWSRGDPVAPVSSWSVERRCWTWYRSGWCLVITCQCPHNTMLCTRQTSSPGSVSGGSSQPPSPPSSTSSTGAAPPLGNDSH